MASANGITYNKCAYMIRKKQGPTKCDANCFGEFCWNHTSERREKQKQSTTRYQERYRASETGRSKYNEYHKNYEKQKRVLNALQPIVV